tara:strand:+ start:364 stop:789 length:426 start_codon:yes stop_codon:yes gene_type:complete
VDRSSDAQKSKEYLKLNPAGRIPAIVHGDLVQFESSAICIFICELDATSRFIPPLGEPARSMFIQWLAYRNKTLKVKYMLWRYAEKYTTDTQRPEGVRAAQDPRLADILISWRKSLMASDSCWVTKSAPAITLFSCWLCGA